MKCRFCNLDLKENEAVSAPSYWAGLPLPCHLNCRADGIKQEAFDCQVIDADCNDCGHFKRGSIIFQMLSAMENGKAVMKKVNMGVIHGHCLKFDRPTKAYPNKWTGHECFEHRRK